MRFIKVTGLIALAAFGSATSVETQGKAIAPLVARIDHVMYTGGLELNGLLELLGDKLRLPVAFDGRTQTPASPGVCFSLGNTCLEVVPLPVAQGEPPRVAGLGSLFMEARDFAAVVDSLKARSIDHFPPAQQARWTTIGLRGLGGGTFFIEYGTGMRERGPRFRQLLDERQGGTLGIVRVVELTRTVQSERQEIASRLTRVFGEPSPRDADLWKVPDGPEIRITTDTSMRNRIVVEVKNLRAASESLTRLGLPFTALSDTLAIDPVSMFGLRLVLIGRGAQHAPGDTVR